MPHGSRRNRSSSFADYLQKWRRLGRVWARKSNGRDTVDAIFRPIHEKHWNVQWALSWGENLCAGRSDRLGQSARPVSLTTPNGKNHRTLAWIGFHQSRRTLGYSKMDKPPRMFSDVVGMNEEHKMWLEKAWDEGRTTRCDWKRLEKKIKEMDKIVCWFLVFDQLDILNEFLANLKLKYNSNRVYTVQNRLIGLGNWSDQYAWGADLPNVVTLAPTSKRMSYTYVAMVWFKALIPDWSLTSYPYICQFWVSRTPDSGGPRK